jgi:hypothetical protein
MIAVCVVVFAIGCVRPARTIDHDVSFDYDVNADFSRLKTYQWVSMPATIRIEAFNQARIREYVNTELGTRGLTLTEDNPDMFVAMFGGDYKAVDMTVLMDYDVYTVGRLKLAFFDAASNREIWWGETKANLSHDMAPELKDYVTKSAVTRILENFPPKR